MLTLPISLQKIRYVSRPQPLNYDLDILVNGPQCRISPLYFLNHLVGTVMAVGLDLLLKACSNLNQVMRIHTPLYIPSMCHSSNLPTARKETSFQLLTMVSLPNTNRESFRGDEGSSWDHLACCPSMLQSLRRCRLLLDQRFPTLRRNVEDSDNLPLLPIPMTSYPFRLPLPLKTLALIFQRRLFCQNLL